MNSNEVFVLEGLITARFETKLSHNKYIKNTILKTLIKAPKDETLFQAKNISE